MSSEEQSTRMTRLMKDPKEEGSKERSHAQSASKIQFHSPDVREDFILAGTARSWA